MRTPGRRRAAPAVDRRRATGCGACCAYMLDESEFLSPYGIRALSRLHRDAPLRAARRRAASTASTTSRASRRPALFGGNSNWRGPIWFPVNYLLIESLQKFHHYFGDDFKVECPTGSGQHDDAVRGRRPSCRGASRASSCADERRPAARVTATTSASSTTRTGATCVLFYEYFHGDNGARRRRQPPDRLDRRSSPSCCSRAASVWRRPAPRNRTSKSVSCKVNATAARSQS